MHCVSVLLNGQYDRPAINLMEMINRLSIRNSMIIALKPCVACNKDYSAKLLHDGVCEKCLAAVVIKKWLRADG